MSILGNMHRTCWKGHAIVYSNPNAISTNDLQRWQTKMKQLNSLVIQGLPYGVGVYACLLDWTISRTKVTPTMPPLGHATMPYSMLYLETRWDSLNYMVWWESKCAHLQCHLWVMQHYYTKWCALKQDETPSNEKVWREFKCTCLQWYFESSNHAIFTSACFSCACKLTCHPGVSVWLSLPRKFQYLIVF